MLGSDKNDNSGCVRDPVPPAASPRGSRESVYVEKMSVLLIFRVLAALAGSSLRISFSVKENWHPLNGGSVFLFTETLTLWPARASQSRQSSRSLFITEIHILLRKWSSGGLPELPELAELG